jgi:AcrR family transcriptional regulator
MRQTTESRQPVLSVDPTLTRLLFDTESDDPDNGLRERKRRMLRQQLSDTATKMFLERGFDSVPVTEIAKKCNVSEKTVYNHFPVKESLLLDREDAMTEALRAAITNINEPPLSAMVYMLNNEVQTMTTALEGQKDWKADVAMVQRFLSLVENTPSLRSYQYDIMERLTSVAAVILAERTGLVVESPEPQIIAELLVGLWKVQHRALRRVTNGTYTPHEIASLVNNEVRNAAHLLDVGIGSMNLSASTQLFRSAVTI